MSSPIAGQGVAIQLFGETADTAKVTLAVCWWARGVQSPADAKQTCEIIARMTSRGRVKACTRHECNGRGSDHVFWSACFEDLCVSAAHHVTLAQGWV